MRDSGGEAWRGGEVMNSSLLELVMVFCVGEREEERWKEREKYGEREEERCRE